MYHAVAVVDGLTLRVGEWRTGAGGEGGPRGIFWFTLNLGGSIGSFWASTILIILCLAPELYATPCWAGVYLQNSEWTTVCVCVLTKGALHEYHVGGCVENL